MHWFKGGALALIVALTPMAAQALTFEAAAVSQDEAARRMALSRRYIELMQTDQFEGVIRAMISAESLSDPDARSMPAEDREFITRLASDLTVEMMPLMFDRLVPVYAEVFTEAELQALILFYDTPMGREIIRKTMDSMPRANEAMMAILPQLLDKMAIRMCEYYGCDPDEIRDVIREGAGLEPSSQARPRTK